MIRAIAALACLLPCGAAHACGIASDRLAEGKLYMIAYRTVPATIAVGEHFAVEFTVCPRGKARLPRTVRVDARMPEHRHGMNYTPTVVAKSAGVYSAEGLLFHMDGRWELAFDIVTGSTTERVTSTVIVE